MGWKKEFYELYASNDNDKLIQAQELKKMNLPEKLYRYRTVTENNLELRAREIVNGELYLAKPSELNDPLEGYSILKYSNYVEYINKSIFEEYYKLKGKLDDVSKIFESDNWLELLDKYEGDNSNIGEEMRVMIERFNAELNQITRNIIRLACFTTNCLNLPMWHHYTNEHKGICLEYDTNSITDLLQVEKLFPVKYADKLIDMSYLMAHNEQPLYTAFELLTMSKLKDWKYEDEWRLIFNAGYWNEDLKNVSEEFKNTGKTIKFIKPSKILLGKDISIKYEKVIRNYAEIASIPVVKAIITEYGLAFD